MLDSLEFVRWFRGSSPYIHAHRGRTFVVSFGGEAVADGLFAGLAHDFALLNSLGIRLVLVHGFRPQVEDLLHLRGQQPRYKNGLRITDSQALLCVKEAAGMVRVEIEALLSMGVANSPMAAPGSGWHRATSSPPSPWGCATGWISSTPAMCAASTPTPFASSWTRATWCCCRRRYSPTGEVFNLSAEEVATAVAIALQADKLLLLMEQEGLSNKGQPTRQLTTQEAETLLRDDAGLSRELRAHLKAALAACVGGVARCHLISRELDGAMLLELFTRDGVGTLVSAAPFEDIRTAAIDDVGGILELIAPLEAQGILVPRTRERLEMEIDDYTVIERDGMIVGCAALHTYASRTMAELACLVLHPEYRGEKRGDRLLALMEERARKAGVTELFVLTTHAEHWFRERGFATANVAALPLERQALYNPNRNSKVLTKAVDN